MFKTSSNNSYSNLFLNNNNIETSRTYQY